MSLFLCTGNVEGNFQLFQKKRDETHAAITKIDTMTSKQENVVIVNAQDSGIVIFSTASNVACLCNDVEDLFIDGTFKCCPCYFYQLYTIHGRMEIMFHWFLWFYQLKQLQQICRLCIGVLHCWNVYFPAIMMYVGICSRR